GSVVWAQRFPGDKVNDLAISPTGDLAIVGTYSGGPITLGSSTFPNQGSGDVFVLELSGASGQPLWARVFGGAGADVPYALAFNSAGEVAVGGGFEGTVDFGDGPRVSHGGVDGFVVQYGSSGAVAQVRTFGGSSDDSARGLGFDSSGHAW